MDPAIATMIQEVSALGTLPAIYRELTETMQDRFSSVDDFSRIIETDVDLTARLLRLANSAYYGFPQRLGTVSEVILLIGVQQLHDLVTGTLVIDFFKGISPNRVTMESFWRHSLSCGVAARVLARHRKDPFPERMFVAGLLHDIGRLVIYMKMPAQAEAIFSLYKPGTHPLSAAERHVLGVDHAEIGGALLRHWRFPEYLEIAVRHHHEPAAAPAHRLEAATVHVADSTVLSMKLGSSGERMAPPIDLEAWRRLAIRSENLPSLTNDIGRQVNEMTPVYLNGV